MSEHILLRCWCRKLWNTLVFCLNIFSVPFFISLVLVYIASSERMRRRGNFMRKRVRQREKKKFRPRLCCSILHGETFIYAASWDVCWFQLSLLAGMEIHSIVKLRLTTRAMREIIQKLNFYLDDASSSCMMQIDGGALVFPPSRVRSRMLNDSAEEEDDKELFFFTLSSFESWVNGFSLSLLFIILLICNDVVVVFWQCTERQHQPRRIK